MVIGTNYHMTCGGAKAGMPAVLPAQQASAQKS